MRNAAILLGLAALVGFGPTTSASVARPDAQAAAARLGPESAPPTGLVPGDTPANLYTRRQLQRDFEAMEAFRPAYSFWQHIFLIPDGAIVYGSAVDGRLLATLPARGDWSLDGIWEVPTLADVLGGQRFAASLTRRRDQLADLLARAAGPVLHNPTRGRFLLPNARRYGSFLAEWGAIYERFGVPAEIGLAHAVVESGLSGTVRSEARAVGFCQWLTRNWNRLKHLAPDVIEAQNQTTQAPYCAAYLSVLATMYGSFIPALSEHHSGGVNVGRTVINGERLGGAEARDQYLLGAEFARDLRSISLRRYREIFRTYGPRSFRYAEMVFGNTPTVASLSLTTPQSRIFAMRAPRSITLAELTRRTGLSSDEVRRYNPALARSVPAGANVYLPSYEPAFGPDVSFWHRQPSGDYASVLDEFVRLDASPTRWYGADFGRVLQSFQERFEATKTEEGAVMATTLAYVMQDLQASRRGAILAEFRSSARIQRLFEQGVRERSTRRDGPPAATLRSR